MSTGRAARRVKAANDGGWRLRNWRVRTRLIALILVPTAAALLLGGLQVSNAARAALYYSRAAQLAEFTGDVGALVHELGAERARMSWYIALGRPERGRPSVDERIAAVDVVAGQVREGAARLDSLPDHTKVEVDTALLRLDDLAGLRDAALKTSLLPGAAIDLYTTVMRDLLALDDELTKKVSDEEFQRQEGALAALAHVKESASRQQALLTTVLVAGSFDQPRLQAFLGELSSENVARKAFGDMATAPERRAFGLVLFLDQVAEMIRRSFRQCDHGLTSGRPLTGSVGRSRTLFPPPPRG